MCLEGRKDDHSAVSGCCPLLWDRWDFWKRAPEACCQLGSWPCLLIFLVSQFIRFCVCPVISHSLQFLPWAQLGLSSPTSLILASEGERVCAALPNQSLSSCPSLRPTCLEEFILSVGPVHSSQPLSVPSGNEKEETQTAATLGRNAQRKTRGETPVPSHYSCGEARERGEWGRALPALGLPGVHCQILQVFRKRGHPQVAQSHDSWRGVSWG